MQAADAYVPADSVPAHDSPQFLGRQGQCAQVVARLPLNACANPSIVHFKKMGKFIWCFVATISRRSAFCLPKFCT